jgi:single-stranded DNA-specific DHH superfamily exonuclease
MVKIDYKTAREFLEGIGPKDNVAIFTHVDLDGFATGRLFQEFCKHKKCGKEDVFFLDYDFKRISDFDVSSYTKFLISDLAPAAVSEDLHLLNSGPVLYTDHHQEDSKFPILKEVLELRTISEGYIPSTRTLYELTEKENANLLWLAGAGVLSDAGNLYPENNDFLKSVYEKYGINEAELLEVSRKMTSPIIFFFPNLKEAFYQIRKLKKLEDLDILLPFSEEIKREMMCLKEGYLEDKIESNGIVFYNFETRFPLIKKTFIDRISSEEKEKVYVFTSRKQEDSVSLSARNQGKIYDVSIVLSDCVRGLKNGGSGGHHFAAGGSVHVDDLETFKSRLRDYKLENARIKHE